MKKTFNLILSALLIFVMISSLALTAFGAETEDYGKSTISEEDVLYVYEEIYKGVAKEVPDATISFSNLKSISMEEMEKATALFVSDHPECFWFRNYYNYSPLGQKILSMSPIYSFTGQALVNAREEFDAAVNVIMSGLPDTNNYDKALYLHDALAKRVVYEQVGEHQTAYGALVSGKAVCAGYAAAYQLLLEKAGIKACTVTGESRGVGHAWNVLWLDKDTCVYTDVTWDDQDGDIFHYYFCISKDEMEADHTTDTDTYLLPDCNHDDKSYFDVTKKIVSDTTPAAIVATMFDSAVDGARSASIYYTGSDFAAWMSENGYDLYLALGGSGGSPSYSRKTLGKELHVTLTGNFPEMTYAVSVNKGSNMYTNADLLQYVNIGEEMTPMTFVANEGYYFPEDYSVTSVGGVRVERVDAKTIKVLGNPTANNISITLPAASVMTSEPIPNVTFKATGEDTGILSGVSEGMRYSLDGKNWSDIDSAGDLEIIGLSEGNIFIFKKGNGESTLDSPRQILKVGKSAKPTLNVVQPTEQGGKGSIETSDRHEYSLDGESWSDCGGELNDLDEGKYYVRVKAIGSVLASDAVELTVKFSATPTLPEDDPEDGGEFGGEGAPPEDGGELGGEGVPPEDNVGEDGKDNGSTDNGSVDDTEDDSTPDATENKTDGDTTEKDKESSGAKVSMCGMTLEGEATLIVIAAIIICFAICTVRKKRQKN